MYTNLSTDQAIKRFKEDPDSDWSWGGATALVEYLETVEDSIGKPIEFDKIRFRCEYSEYPSALQAAEDHGFIPEDDEDEDEIESAAIAYLKDRTTVIQFHGGVIIQHF